MSGIHQTAPDPDVSHDWSVDDATRLYGIDAWSGDRFRISPEGCVVADCAGVTVDLVDVIEGLRARGIETPVLLRLSDVLEARLTEIRDAFSQAMHENAYRGAYRGVYPVKVNQQHHVVGEVARIGRGLGFGLEVGSKPELLAVLGMTCGVDDQLILCNGFKDQAYIELVVLAAKLGRSIIPVVENLDELRLILEAGERFGVQPSIGVRVKLSSIGAGRWKDSVGSRSKFGLFVSEVMEVVRELERRGMLGRLKLLHAHIGSQVQDINRVKDSVAELAHVYVELAKLGAGLEFIDVGGGLGVDYRGERLSEDSSMNYSLQEYASDVVYRIGGACDEAGIEHPAIVTECGRAMVAYSSVLVFEVLGATGPARAVRAGGGAIEPPRDDEAQPIRDLRGADALIDEGRLEECYHDARKAVNDAANLFRLGYLSLEEHALSERLFWSLCRRLRDARDQLEEPPEELEDLDTALADLYFGNLSVFQSLPDSWAIDQVFPIMPLHRLDERPTRKAIIGDLTCDSDGKIQTYVTGDGLSGLLDVHELNDQPYYMGAFLVGAYQETLGDLHNLLGDAHSVFIRVEDGAWGIEELVRGDTSAEVLSYMQHEPERYQSAVARDCDRAVRLGRLTASEAGELMRVYAAALDATTYLEHNANGRGNPA